MSTKKTKTKARRSIQLQRVSGAGLQFRFKRIKEPKPVDVKRLQSSLMRSVGPTRARELRVILSRGQNLLSSLDRLGRNPAKFGVNFGALAQARVKLQESLMWAGASLSGGE